MSRMQGTEYDVPVSGHFDFEWEAKVINHTLLGERCPYMGNDTAWKNDNALSIRMPHIVGAWHSAEKNIKRRGCVHKIHTERVAKIRRMQPCVARIGTHARKKRNRL